ncbi:MAG: fused MFS/spermidine synthase [Anaerolineaceae bacterium]|nr:fused MFS/spermidine synthase [Anaerolineaceae bacterium]
MRRYLYIGVFSAGIATLAVELSASRLLGNYFGSSNLVWASIIGLILIYLSVGYSIGGRWADRSPEYETFFMILLWAGLFIGIIPLASRPILKFASSAFDKMQTAFMIGAFFSVLVLFSVPITLLGTTSPFAIRIALGDNRETGKTAGKIFTISTAGSFIGTFLPVLILIPTIGTYRTFVSISLFLIVICLLGLWATVSFKKMLVHLWMPFLVLLLAYFGLNGFDKQAEGIIFEKESTYNYIQVQQIADYHILRLNEGQGIHSIYHPTQTDFHGPWEQVLSAPFFNPYPVSTGQIKRIAILGLAGGTSANQIHTALPNTIVDGYEIDQEIVNAGKKYFGLDKTNTNIYIEDARWGITHNENLYQVISIDAYNPPYIPWHLTTQEFFTVVYHHLSESGVLVINVTRILEDRSLLDALYQTIDSVFPSTFIVDIPGTFNSMIFATKTKQDASNLIDNYWALADDSQTHPLILSAVEMAILNLQPAPRGGLILTDDKAPIEWISNAMIIKFFLSNQIKVLQ